MIALLNSMLKEFTTLTRMFGDHTETIDGFQYTVQR